MEKNTVLINKIVTSTTKVLDVSGDIIVPDIKPDIVNVINTNGIPYIYKEDLSNGKVRFDGNIDTYVVYLADNGETKSIGATLSFSDSIEDSHIKDTCILKQKVLVELIESKVLNERKITIKASLKVKTEVYETENLEILSNFDTEENLEMLKETLEVKSLIGTNKVKTSIKEDIAVDNYYNVSEILKTSVEIKNTENKISYNKILAKADAEVKVIFLSEDGRIGMASSNIPVMSFIDLEKVADTNTCMTTYTARNMLFKVNSKESHTISCQIEFEVECMAFETKSIDVLEDMYGIKNNVKFSKKEVDVLLAKEISKEKININERVPLENILNIFDVSAFSRKINSTKSGNFYNVEAEVILNIYYEADNRNGLNVKEVVFPFMMKLESDENVDFEIGNKQFTVSGENVNCDIEIFATNNLKATRRISIIENVEIQEREPEEDYKMFMYFVKPGDSVWNIAKKFKVCKSDIIDLNKLENPNKLNVGDRLYIMR